MNYDSLIVAFVTTVGIVMSLGYYPQAYKLWKSKSAGNVSAATYSIFALGATTWFLYGLYRHDAAISSSFVFGVIGSWLVLGLTLYYRNKKGP